MVATSGDGVTMIPTAVITTRGDVDLAPALSGIPDEWPKVIWDNSERDADLKVYGYFAALREVETEYVYTQADDAVIVAQALLAAWTPEDADRILLNVADGETPWISFGAIFRKDLVAPAIDRYLDAYHDGVLHDDVLKWCEVIFCEQTPWRNVDLGKQDLYQGNDNRMEWAKDHYSEQARVRELTRALAVTA